MQNIHPDSFSVRLPAANGYIAKTLIRIPADEVKNYKTLGTGSGPLGMAFHMAINHCPRFAERVVGYTVSEQGIGNMLHTATLNTLPELADRQPESRYSYTFYEEG